MNSHRQRRWISQDLVFDVDVTKMFHESRSIGEFDDTIRRWLVAPIARWSPQTNAAKHVGTAWHIQVVFFVLKQILVSVNVTLVAVHPHRVGRRSSHFLLHAVQSATTVCVSHSKARVQESV